MVESAGDTAGLAGGPGNKHDHSLASLMGSIKTWVYLVAFQTMIYVVSKSSNFHSVRVSKVSLVKACNSFIGHIKRDVGQCPTACGSV